MSRYSSDTHIKTRTHALKSLLAVSFFLAVMSSGCTRLLRLSTESTPSDSSAETVTDGSSRENAVEEIGDMPLEVFVTPGVGPAIDFPPGDNEGNEGSVWVFLLLSGLGVIGLLVALYVVYRANSVRKKGLPSSLRIANPTASMIYGKASQLSTEQILRNLCEETIHEYVRSKEFQKYIQSVVNLNTVSDTDFIRREIEAEVFKVVTREQLGLPIRILDDIEPPITNITYPELADINSFDRVKNINTNSHQAAVVSEYNSDRIRRENAYDIVSITSASLESGRLGLEEEAILHSDRPRGLFWVIESGSDYYVIPKYKARFNLNSLDSLQMIYGFPSSPNLDLPVRLIRLSLVTSVGDEKWQLVHKGELSFG